MNQIEFSRTPIIVGDADQERLMALAVGPAGDDLFAELARAETIPSEALPLDVVRMGARVRFRTRGGGVREVTLVYPDHADIDRGRISVLTPIGTALLGLRAGQSIAWRTRDGRKDVLTVEEVGMPDDEATDQRTG